MNMDTFHCRNNNVSDSMIPGATSNPTVVFLIHYMTYMSFLKI